MKYPKSIEAAIKGIVDGATSDMPVESAKGRPSSKRIVNGIILDRIEYEVYEAIMAFWDQARLLGRDEAILSDEEFIAFQKEAAPRLIKRTIDMALVSDDLKAVRQVASDLADRGYGRAAQQLNINVGIKDIRGAWREIEDRGKLEYKGEEYIDNGCENP